MTFIPGPEDKGIKDPQVVQIACFLGNQGCNHFSRQIT